MRTGWQIQRAVISALFLREVMSRLFGSRAAWLWVLLEPIAHLIFLMTLFGSILNRFHGQHSAVFIVTGLLGFFLVRNTATRAMEAVKANAALYAYRQVRPVDTVIVRMMLEGFLVFACALILLAGAGLAGLRVLPDDPLLVIAAVFGLWLCGSGLALVLSVAGEMVGELKKLARILFMPLYFISGVMFPATAIPQPYREWLLWNPILHGLEMIRLGFFAGFKAASGTGLAYLYNFSLVLILVGLALHVWLARRLVAQ